MFIFERERERDTESASKGGAEREGETQNPKQAPGSELSAQSPMRVFELTNREIKIWATDWGHPGAPVPLCLDCEVPKGRPSLLQSPTWPGPGQSLSDKQFLSATPEALLPCSREGTTGRHLG